MRKAIIAAAATAAFLITAVPASAATDVGTAAGKPATARGEWTPVPSAPFDVPAGARCDFPVHGEPIVDEVRKMVLQTYRDGSPKREMYAGALIFRVTNTLTGQSIDVDISGTGVVRYTKPGGFFGGPNSTAEVYGPILLGIAEGLGNLPRGLYVPNGVYTLSIDEAGFRTVKWRIDGGAFDICGAL